MSDQDTKKSGWERLDEVFADPLAPTPSELCRYLGLTNLSAGDIEKLLRDTLRLASKFPDVV